MMDQVAVTNWQAWDIEKLAETYSFLDDGVFEKWMPVIEMDHSSSEYLELKKEADRLLKQALWIRERFPDYHSEEWQLYNQQIKRLNDKVVI